MATVSETLDLPGGSTPGRCAVVIQLAGSDGVPLAAGYGSVAGTTIVGEHVVFSDETTGVWTVDLPRNNQITPSGTAWKITLKGRGMSRDARYIDVDGAGPFEVEDILTTAPASIADAALEAHADATTTVHGIADTSVLETTTGAQTKATAAQAAAVQRANHTGTQLAATISDFDSAAVAAGSGTYAPLTTQAGVVGWRATGTGNNAVITPDHAAFDPTASLDVRVAVALTDWTPAAQSTLISKYGNAGDRSWSFFVNTTGVLGLTTSADGTALVNAQSTVAPTVADGAILAVRAVWDSTTPSVVFYTKATTMGTAHDDLSDDDGWTQLGTTITGATVAASIFASAAAVHVGQNGNTGNPSNGVFSGAWIKVDAVAVAEWDGRAPMIRYIDSTGKTWTPTGSAWGWAGAAWF